MNGLIITDLDNTVYNWVDYFAPCFRAMVHALARETGESERAIIEAFCQVYQARGSVEYAFSVQELSIFQDRSEEEVINLVRIAKGAFTRVREKRLRPYPTVNKTLIWIRSQGHRIVAVTNAPVVYAFGRLRQLRIQHLFDGLAGRKNYDIPQGAITRKVQERADKGYFAPPMLTWEFELDELKPNSRGYARVIGDLAMPAKNVWVVGDNTQRDLVPGIQLGAIGVWAKYGEVVDKKNLDTILELTAWKKENILSERITSSFSEINDFSELTELIPTNQMTLHGFS